MKLLGAVLLVGAAGLTALAVTYHARIRCWLREWHNAVRHPLGGWRCADCRVAGADLDEMGFVDGGYVDPIRRTYGRGAEQGLSRTTSWDEEGAVRVGTFRRSA